MLHGYDTRGAIARPGRANLDRGETMDPLTRDMVHGVAGMAWEDAEPNDKKAARRWGVSRRTATRYRHEGPPWLRAAIEKLILLPDPWRIVATLMGSVKQAAVAGLTRPALIARYHELRVTEIRYESRDTILDREPNHDWLERARATERDVRINAEKAACEREFYRRRIPYTEVYHA